MGRDLGTFFWVSQEPIPCLISGLNAPECGRQLAPYEPLSLFAVIKGDQTYSIYFSGTATPAATTTYKKAFPLDTDTDTDSTHLISFFSLPCPRRKETPATRLSAFASGPPAESSGPTFASEICWLTVSLPTAQLAFIRSAEPSGRLHSPKGPRFPPPTAGLRA